MSDEDTLKLVIGLLKSGDSPTRMAILVLVISIFIARKLLVKRIPWLATDRAGVLMTVLMAFGGAAGATIISGGTLTMGLAVSALGAAVSASGGWSLITKFLWPDEGKKLSPSLRPSVTMPAVTPGGVPQVDDRNDNPKGGAGDR